MLSCCGKKYIQQSKTVAPIPTLTSLIIVVAVKVLPISLLILPYCCRTSSFGCSPINYFTTFVQGRKRKRRYQRHLILDPSFVSTTIVSLLGKEQQLYNQYNGPLLFGYIQPSQCTSRGTTTKMVSTTCAGINDDNNSINIKNSTSNVIDVVESMSVANSNNDNNNSEVNSKVNNTSTNNKSKISKKTNTTSSSSTTTVTVNGTVTVLYENQYCLVVSKDPSVLCHHSDWAGSRSSSNNNNNKKKKNTDIDIDIPEIPMIQRVREALGGQRYVNLVHRLDRGASGCLVMTYTNDFIPIPISDLNTTLGTSTTNTAVSLGIDTDPTSTSTTCSSTDKDHDTILSNEISSLRLIAAEAAAADSTSNKNNENDSKEKSVSENEHSSSSSMPNVVSVSTTALLSTAMAERITLTDAEIESISSSSTSTSSSSVSLTPYHDIRNMTKTKKLYIAIVRGEGIVHGHDYKKDGWFIINRPIKNEYGIIKNATTSFRFLAGQDSYIRSNDTTDTMATTSTHNSNDNNTTVLEINDIKKPRVCIVLAIPHTGRWHQIRRHLNGLSHPILGDSTHGDTRTNRLWREQRNLHYERICLHLLQIQFQPIPIILPTGLNVICDIPSDMYNLLQINVPETLQQAESILLKEEGIHLRGNNDKSYQQSQQHHIRHIPYSINVQR